MTSISILKIIEDTIVDGTGFRTSIYAAGCPHKCVGCHNPESWSIENGTFMTAQEIYTKIQCTKLNNVTFTGGDPMFQAEGFLQLATLIKNNTNKTIWCYTGYLFEQLKDPVQQKLLAYMDVLVDGKFDEKLKDYTLRFKGSSNQRIIDVTKTLKERRIILWNQQY